MPPNPTLFNRPRYTAALAAQTTPIDVNLARYGEPELNRAYDALRALSVSANYQVQAHAQYARMRNCHLWNNNVIDANHNVVAKAFTRRKRELFMVKLADMQNDSTNDYARGIITQYVNAMDAAHPGPNYQNPTPALVNNFDNSAAVIGGAGVTLARHGLERVTTHFINLITDVCDHVAADWELINDMFFPDVTMISLCNIKIMESDPHKGGKRVCFIDFEVLPPDDPIIPARWYRAARGGPNHIDGRNLPTRRLVYKPFDMEMDYRFVANTAEAANRLGAANAAQLPPTNFGGSLLEVVDPNLPTYLILPRNFGSAMAQDEGNVANIRNAYGYIEFLSHEPERDPNTFDPMRVLQPNGNPKSWSRCEDHELDWIATRVAEVDDFYDTMGQYMAIAMTFSMADCHHGNVMVHRRRPHLIDLEIAFKSPTATVVATVLHRGVAGHEDVHEPTYNQLYYYRGRGDPRPTWLLRDNGRFAPGNFRNRQVKWFNKLADGFDKALRRMIMIEGNGGNALTNWLADPHVQNSFARYTVEPTGTYFGRLQYLCRNHILEPVPALLSQAAGALNWAGMAGGYAGLPAWCRNVVVGWLGAGETYGLRGWTTTTPARVNNPDRPIWATHFPHNLIDLLNWDIPGYYHRINNMHLLNSHGRVVDIPAWDAHWLVAPPANEWWWVGYTNLGAPEQANFQAMLPNQTVDFFRVLPTAFVTTQINNLTDPARQADYNTEMAWIPNIMAQINVPNS